MPEERRWAVVARERGREVVVLFVDTEAEADEIVAGMQPSRHARVVPCPPGGPGGTGGSNQGR